MSGGKPGPRPAASAGSRVQLLTGCSAHPPWELAVQHLPAWNPLIQVVTSYRAVDTALHARQWGSKHLEKAFTATSLSSFWRFHYFLLHLVIFTYCFKNAKIVPLLEKALVAEEALSSTAPGLFWGQRSTWPDSCAQCPSERANPQP